MVNVVVAALFELSALGAGEPSYAAAYQRMNDSGCPLVVLVGADWCPACQTMKMSVLPQLKNSGRLASVAFAVVDYDRETAIARRLMRGNSIPQLIMFHKSAAGWQRSQLTGRQSVEAVAALIKQGADAF
jgi:thioredoxin-like negative regulator of GroEL